MRRALMALMGTAAGTVLLVGAKAGFSSPQVDQAMQPQSANSPAPGASPTPPGASPAPGGALPPSAGPSAAPPGASQPAAGATKTAAQPAANKTTAPAARPTTTAPRPPAMKDGTFNGNPIHIEYGSIELSIVVSGGKITDIKVLDSPKDQSRSVQINNSALPKLRAEALAAQSADIDTVSGATYTSSGYKFSLQSAIDRAFQA
ncbi:FMN-binding protein [Dactylosporangium sp. NPDC051484]|uniref:FMN-binding protein n=1 Tax=Dactylosporangium sp. NPDC051484 TaxID=3154942 RepID=UPI00344DB3F6